MENIYIHRLYFMRFKIFPLLLTWFEISVSVLVSAARFWYRNFVVNMVWNLRNGISIDRKILVSELAISTIYNLFRFVILVISGIILVTSGHINNISIRWYFKPWLLYIVEDKVRFQFSTLHTSEKWYIQFSFPYFFGSQNQTKPLWITNPKGIKSILLA